MTETTNESSIRVLIADDEVRSAERLLELLKGHGFDVQLARTGSEAKRQTIEWRPHFVFYDLMLPELNALAYLRQCKSADLLKDGKLQVFVLSGHNNPQNVRECLKLGASDYLVRPIAHNDLLSRLVLHTQARREVPDFLERPKGGTENALYYLHLTDLMLREALKPGEALERLHNLTGLLSFSTKAVRVSIVKADFEGRLGWVMASNDKRDIAGLELHLAKYPEILYVLRHDKLLAIDNLNNDPTLKFMSNLKKSIHFNSLMVCPIRIRGQMWGVVSVRMPDTKERLSEFEIRYGQLVAHIAGLVIDGDTELRHQLLSPSDSKAG